MFANFRGSSLLHLELLYMVFFVVPCLLLALVVTPARMRSRGKAMPSCVCVCVCACVCVCVCACVYVCVSAKKILKNASNRVAMVLTDVIINEKQSA